MLQFSTLFFLKKLIRARHVRDRPSKRVHPTAKEEGGSWTTHPYARRDLSDQKMLKAWGEKITRSSVHLVNSSNVAQRQKRRSSLQTRLKSKRIHTVIRHVVKYGVIESSLEIRPKKLLIHELTLKREAVQATCQHERWRAVVRLENVAGVCSRDITLMTNTVSCARGPGKLLHSNKC